MYNMLLKCSLWKVARVFFDEPFKKHTLKDVSKKSGLAHTSVTKHLKVLRDSQVIVFITEIHGSRKFKHFMANPQSNTYKLYKKYDIIERVYLSDLTHWLERALTPTAIVLFGSSSRGEDDESSDVDLFVQTSSKNVFDATPFEAKLKRNIQLHIKRDIKEYSKELQNNILNGITLYGYVEAIK